MGWYNESSQKDPPGEGIRRSMKLVYLGLLVLNVDIVVIIDTTNSPYL
jgi:hypothetical protein